MEKECPVCFTKDWLSLTPCKHTICIDCLFKITKNECPICRAELFINFPKSLKKHLQISSHLSKNNFDIDDPNQFPLLSNHPFS